MLNEKKLATLRKISDNIIKAQSELGEVFSMSADGFKMCDVFYLVQDAQQAIKRLSNSSRHVQRLIDMETGDYPL